MSLQVWHEHKVLKSYPDGTPWARTADDRLLIGSDEYPPDATLAAAGTIACAFTNPRDDCPNCHPVNVP